MRRIAWTWVLLLAAGALRADGPHWYVPEPPEYDSLLLDKDEPTLKRYVTAMTLARGADDIQSEILSVCIRYLREYEDYVAAPDSPEPWHSQEGRDQMARNAVETMRILSVRPELCQRVVDAFADQVRFRDDLSNGKLGPALKEFVDLNQRLSKLLQAWNAANERCLELRERLAQAPAEQRAGLKAELDKLEAKAKPLHNAWSDLAKREIPPALKNCQKDLPRSFVRNMTGDIPFLQDDAAQRFRDALKRIGMIAVPHLQKLLKHPHAAVAAEAAELLKAIGERVRNPPTAGLTKAMVAREVHSLKDLRTPRAMVALQTLRSYGDRVLPFLLEIAKDEELKLRREAFGALYSLTGQLFGDKQGEWETYVAKRLERAAARAEAQRKDDQPGEAVRAKP